jgi:AbrB family looped-hinge helix DNA binding protein
MATTVSSKGQVTIPKWIREALRIERGTKVDFILSDGCARMKTADHSAAAEAAGSLRAYGRRRPGGSEKDRMEKVRKEVADAAADEGRASRHKRAG